MQRHGDEPVYSQSALGRDRGMKVKLVTMVVISRLLSVREPQRRLNNRTPGRWGLFLRCQGSCSGCGEDRHQPREHARFHGVNRAVHDGAKTPPANTKRVPAP
jgi:hypothetical protein